jgi:putative intracellular protease/amidase
MKPAALLFIFDGLADWEPAHALCEINKSGKFDVVTVGSSQVPVTTMGGLKLAPEITLDQVNPAEAAIFILPGGDMWEKQSDDGVKALLQRLHMEGILIGAICGATLEIARAGLTRRIRHTSNSKDYLKTLVDDYRDEEFYVDVLAVTDKKIITASGLGSIEFGREVIKQLSLYNEADTQVWFEMFKHGVIPPSEAL